MPYPYISKTNNDVSATNRDLLPPVMYGWDTNELFFTFNEIVDENEEDKDVVEAVKTVIPIIEISNVNDEPATSDFKMTTCHEMTLHKFGLN